MKLKALNLYLYLCLFLSLILLLLSPSFLSSQEKPLTDEAKKAAVERIGSLLEERYVFPDVAKKCAEHLKSQLAKGVFDASANTPTFAEALTKELQSVSRDKHMRVRARQQPQGGPRDPLMDALLQQQQVAEGNRGVAGAQVLDGNVGLLDIRFFPQTEPARATVNAALKVLENVDALIVDLRRNGGGNPDLIRYWCSHFFPPKTHLNSLYWRDGDRTEEFWTLDSIDGKRRPDVPVFILTSGRTFSGGEEFAYNFQSRKRATLIGETTGGGANPGGGFPVNEDLVIFIPTGRAINPITKTNWEGVGVVPEIKTSADEALEKALPLAREAAKKYAEKRRSKGEEVMKSISAGMKTGEMRLAEKKTVEGEKAVFDALASGVKEGVVDEGSINTLGYSYLSSEKTEMAIAIFRFNVERYPQSSNVYDSLAEALMKAGKNEEAIKNYQKSIELDPRNDNAKKMIEKMRGK